MWLGDLIVALILEGCVPYADTPSRKPPRGSGNIKEKSEPLPGWFRLGSQDSSHHHTAADPPPRLPGAVKVFSHRGSAGWRVERQQNLEPRGSGGNTWHLGVETSGWDPRPFQLRPSCLSQRPKPLVCRGQPHKCHPRALVDHHHS